MRVFVFIVVLSLILILPAAAQVQTSNLQTWNIDPNHTAASSPYATWEFRRFGAHSPKSAARFNMTLPTRRRPRLMRPSMPIPWTRGLRNGTTICAAQFL